MDDFKKAIFSGSWNMTCAAWDGYGNFSNDNIFKGKFEVLGTNTQWLGNFNIVGENNKLVIKAITYCILGTTQIM